MAARSGWEQVRQRRISKHDGERGRDYSTSVGAPADTSSPTFGRRRHGRPLPPAGSGLRPPVEPSPRQRGPLGRLAPASAAPSGHALRRVSSKLTTAQGASHPPRRILRARAGAVGTRPLRQPPGPCHASEDVRHDRVAARNEPGVRLHQPWSAGRGSEPVIGSLAVAVAARPRKRWAGAWPAGDG